MLSILEYQALAFRRHWRSTIIASAVAPLLYLLALGLGIGALVDRGVGPATIGTTYLAFLAPALLAVAGMQIAAGEAMFPVLGGFKWTRAFFAMHGAPLTPGQISSALIIWLWFRVAASSLVFLLLTACFGAFKTPLALLVVPIAAYGAVAFAAPIVAFSASQEEGAGSFSVITRFGIAPMILFSGTFYDISRLPRWAGVLAWISPLWHVTELCRAVALGPLGLSSGLGAMTWSRALVHIGYLTLWLVVGVLLARWTFRVRLTR